MPKHWFTVKNASAGVLDVSIHDEIGIWGVSARDFIEAINAEKGVREINVSIHSPGGSAFDGIAMYTALAQHPARVLTHVAGVAASAASIVLMAGDIVTMPEDTFVMIHNPWNFAMGDAREMRDAAEFLDKVTASLVGIYARKTRLEEQTIRELMDEETWMDAEEARSYGFADVVVNPQQVAALAPQFVRHFKNVPEQLRAGEKTPRNIDLVSGISNVKEYERFLREAGGMSKGLATALASRAREIFRGDPDEDPEANELGALIERIKAIKLNGDK